MKNAILSTIEQEQLKENTQPFNVGDSVKVHTLVKEGEKERVQIFAGLVISRRGEGVNEAFTVRKISYGEGVERVFPIHSPRIAKIEVSRKGKVRRAKLHYLRDRIGKKALLVKSAELPSKAAQKKKEAASKAKQTEKAPVETLVKEVAEASAAVAE